MKKIISFLLLLFVVCSLPAQKRLLLSFGEGYAQYHPSNLNRTVYTYNYTRSWLTTKMPYFKNAKGWEFILKKTIGDDGGGGWQFMCGNFSELNEASGIETATGLPAKRQVRMSCSNYGFGIYANVKNGRYFKFSPTLDLNVMFFRVFTHYENSQPNSYEDDEPVHQARIGNTLGFDMEFYATKWLGIRIRPYYAQPWARVNMEGLMNYLQGQDGEIMREHMRSYGVTGSVILSFGKD